jgi:DHA2 family multidrug resistance protein
MNDSLAPGVAPKIWIAFSIMCLGMFMAILDIQIVSTALPTIRAALHIAPDQMVWIQTAYLTAEIVAIPLTGYLTRLIACAASDGFAALIAARVVQGFAGGTLIPAVFSAVFLLFPARQQGLATTLAGVAAVLAPTMGPVVGGWITQTYSWHWLFLVNVAPGVIASAAAAWLLRTAAAMERGQAAFDGLALAALAAALTALELALKDAPGQGWNSARVLGELAVMAGAAAVFALRTLRARHPVVELRLLRNRNFAVGSALSFVLGVGLFGSTYLMPFFLGLVREHGALAIGQIMLVTGVAQLAAAPLAVALERRLDPRLLTLFGFALFGAGLLLSARQTVDTDAAEMMVPQILRGAAIMFCLLPPTRLALGQLTPALVADGSGLFNLMRNLGGAIGLALIDTIIFSRSPHYARLIEAQLRAGDVATAVRIGIPRDAFLENLGEPVDDITTEMVRPLVEKAALVQALNDAWLAIGLVTVAALLLVWLVRRNTPRS